MNKNLYVCVLILIAILSSCCKELHFGFLEINQLVPSNSVRESKNNDCYYDSYLPISSDYKLKYHNDTIKFDTAWIEKSIFYKSAGFMLYRVIKNDKYTMIMPLYSSFPDSFLYNLIPVNKNKVIDYNGIFPNKGRKEVLLNFIPDTLELSVYEKNLIDLIGSKKLIKTGTIKYIKYKNGM